MYVFLSFCLTYNWTPASGSVDHYTAYDLTSGEIVAEEIFPPYRACFYDFEPHQFAVQAYDAEGLFGPLSDPAPIAQMILQPPVTATPIDAVSSANFDRKPGTLNTVDGGDFGAFSQLFGRCSFNGLEVACE